MKKYFVIMVLLMFCRQTGLAEDVKNDNRDNNKTSRQVLVKHSKKFEKIRQNIIKMMKLDKIPSLAIAVALKGKIIWEEAFGWADRKNMRSATPYTVYPLASMSKSLSGTALMLLVEQGKVHLNDPVSKYIAPAKLQVYEGNAKKLTVRDVIEMTAGIPHGYISYKMDKQKRQMETSDFVSKYAFSVFSPGEVFHYSNISFSIIDLIIEKVSGKSLEDFMYNNVFKPLGMFSSAPYITSVLKKNLAVKYTRESKIIPDSTILPSGGLGYFSSAHDILKYGMFYAGRKLKDQKQILSKKTIKLMLTCSENKQFPDKLASLGWGSVDLGDNIIWNISNGRIEGASSMLTLIPSKEIVVVCLTNITSSKIADMTAIQITDVLIPGFMKKCLKKMGDFESKFTPKPYDVRSDLLGRWNGEIKAYKRNIPVELNFQSDGDIHIKLKNQYKTLLNNPTFTNGMLTGSFSGNIPTEFNKIEDFSIYLQIRLSGNKLSGFVKPYFKTDFGEYWLPTYIVLTKKR